MKKTTLTIYSAMLAALICVATMVIKIPSPVGGYANAGDALVLLAGFVLPPHFAFLSAAVGSALADLFSGYVIYAPATFIIKGAVALAMCYSSRRSPKGSVFSLAIDGLIAEVVMVGGYLLYESFLYGFAPSLLNVSINAVQGVVGIILSIPLIKIYSHVSRNIKK